MKRKRKLIIHCSASPYAHHGIDEIRRWHTDPKPLGNGWSDIGYHFCIEVSGELKKGRSLYKSGAHTRGHNKEIGLCLCGMSGEFNNDQMRTLEGFILDNRHIISEIGQHSQYDAKKPYCAGLTQSQLDYLNSLL